MVKQLGDGTYGNVWKAINRQTNEVVSSGCAHEHLLRRQLQLCALQWISTAAYSLRGGTGYCIFEQQHSSQLAVDLCVVLLHAAQHGVMLGPSAPAWQQPYTRH